MRVSKNGFIADMSNVFTLYSATSPYNSNLNSDYGTWVT